MSFSASFFPKQVLVFLKLPLLPDSCHCSSPRAKRAVWQSHKCIYKFFFIVCLGVIKVKWDWGILVATLLPRPLCQLYSATGGKNWAAICLAALHYISAFIRCDWLVSGHLKWVSKDLCLVFFFLIKRQKCVSIGFKTDARMLSTCVYVLACLHIQDCCVCSLLGPK